MCDGLPSALGEGLHLGDCWFKGFGRRCFAVDKHVGQLAVVPEGLLCGAAKPLENRWAFVDEIGHDGAGVVEFVWAADQEDFVWSFLQVFQVRRLSL